MRERKVRKDQILGKRDSWYGSLVTKTFKRVATCWWYWTGQPQSILRRGVAGGSSSLAATRLLACVAPPLKQKVSVMHVRNVMQALTHVHPYKYTGTGLESCCGDQSLWIGKDILYII